MLTFLARRLVALVVMLAASAVVIFLITEILPGDPAAVMLGITATPETIATLRTELGLDRPAFARFLSWIAGFVTGDLGLSYTYRVPVGGLIAERFGVTVPLAMMALALAALLGITFGTIAAARAHSRLDALLMVGAQVGLAIPNFWFGLLLVLTFAITLGWFPAGGFPGWSEPGQALRALLLPAIALALPQGAVLARISRSAVLETLHEDFIRTARAKGLTRWQTLRRHALRNAFVPILTLMGMQFSYLLAGTIIIENVFALPGLGRLLVQAVGGHDLILIKSLVMVFAAKVIVINAGVDLAYGLIDPRLRPT